MANEEIAPSYDGYSNYIFVVALLQFRPQGSIFQHGADHQQGRCRERGQRRPQRAEQQRRDAVIDDDAAVAGMAPYLYSPSLYSL